MALVGNQAYIYGISNFTIGSNAITYTVDKYAGTTDNLTVKIGSTTVATRSNVTGTTTNSGLTRTITFSAAELTSIYNAMPTVTKATFTFTLTSYISGSSIGSSSTTATGTIASTVAPSISSIGLIEAVSAISSRFGSYIQNHSQIKGTITATGGTGSSIASYKTVINEQTFSSQTFTTRVLKTAGSNTVTVTVTDRRGRTATKTATFNVTAYEKPVLEAYSVVRCLADGTENISGDFAKVTLKATITALNNENEERILLEYKAKKDANWTTLFMWDSGYNFNIEGQVVEGISSNSAYDFRLTLSDSFNESVIVKALPTGFATMDLLAGGKGVAFGKVATEKDTLDIGFKNTFMSNELFMGGEKRDEGEKNIYFQNTGSGKYTHNAKIYGGNGNSPASIGMYDVGNAHSIYRYLCDMEQFEFDPNIKLLQDGKAVVVERTYTHSHNTGSVHFSNGLLIQHGLVSITPTVANAVTSATIIFPIAFDTRPTPAAIVQTSAPSAIQISVGQGSANLDRFSIFVERASIQATTVHWFAIGYKGV